MLLQVILEGLGLGVLLVLICAAGICKGAAWTEITNEEDPPMIALIDYDAGNIKSVEKAFQSLGKEVVLTRDPEVLKRADHVVLPGVGSFGDAMENLNRYHLVPVIHEIVEKGTPFLGICLGLQILFERSEESPGVEGLGLLKGEILRIPDKEGLKIPHMGWNSIHLQNEGRLFKGISQESYVYFVHSYYLKPQKGREASGGSKTTISCWQLADPMGPYSFASPVCTGLT